MADPVRLLIAANDFSISHALAEIAHKRAWHVIFATNASFAQPVAERSKCHAIVLHSQLQGGAMEAISSIQASAQTAHIPLFVITDSHGNDREELLAAGAQHCFAAPIDGEAIIAAITDFVPKELVVAVAPAALTGNIVRLRALYESKLLDTEPSPEFDELTALAAKLINVPTVLVSLVDKDRQFFKSQVGLGEPWASKRQTPLSHSFCQWVISEEKELLVFDAREHPVLRNNLAVRDLGVLAYAGIPLIAAPNKSIGSFCAIDSKPHEWTEYEVSTIEDLAQIANSYIVMQQISNASDGTEAAALSPALRLEAASSAIGAAMRIINRGGTRFRNKERQQLMAIVRQMSEELLRYSEEKIA